MLAKSFRLPASVQFTHPRTFSEKEFFVKAQANTLATSRYGFVVSKAIDKRATVRNRLRRIVRSCIEEKWLQKNGWDILFLVKPAIKEASKEVIQAKIDALMGNL